MGPSFLAQCVLEMKPGGVNCAILYLLQMGTSKVLTTLPLQNQNSWQLSLLELPPCCVPARNTVTSSTVTSTVTPHYNTVTSPLDSSDMYTSTVQSGTPSTNAALRPHPYLLTTYSPSAHFVFSSFASSPPLLAPGCPSTPPASSPLTPSEFFNGMLVVLSQEH